LLTLKVKGEIMNTKKLAWFLLLVLSLAIIIPACGGGGGGGGFTVTLASSSTNVTAIGSITLTASATGGTLASVVFKRNGADIATVSAAPFTTSVNLSSADNGTISFTATGTDSTGETDTSNAVEVTVNIPADVTDPTVTLSSSVTDVTTAGFITLTANATDDVGVNRVEFFKNGAPLGQLAGPGPTLAFQAPITQDDNGTVNFTAKAFDAAGNDGDSNSVAVTVSISEATLLRPSKSGAIAISGNDRYILQVNPENDSLSIFRSASNEELSEVLVGDEPSSVVVHPDDESAFVALRGEAKVVKVIDINDTSASVDDEVDVGSEPTGIALSPSGRFLAVAEFAESRLSLIDTTTMTIEDSVEIRNPRAVAITNDGDLDDDDETIIVTEFYGEVNAGTVEGQDNTRIGVVRTFTFSSSGTLSEEDKIEFPPVSLNGAFVPTLTSPNQLYSVIITPDNEKFIVTATAASPSGVPKFNENIFQLLLVGDVDAGTNLGTVNISAAIKAQVPDDEQLFMADIVDLSLVGNNIIYLVSRGADGFQRAVLNADNANVTLGSSFNKQLDLLSLDGVEKDCQAPIGIVAAHDVSDNKTIYVNCWVTRRMMAIDLATQSIIDSFAAGAPASGDEAVVNRGRRFYFTGRTRWSDEGWSSCGSCHPDGLSDNITWQFPAGPRQSTSMDGSFSHGPGTQKQRIFNWSGIFDELHDFERNTRGVSGGFGALTTGTSCGGDLSGETQIDIAAIGNLAQPLKEVQDTTPNICVKDWDEIDEFVRTIRPPLGLRFPSGDVDEGRDLFDEGNCTACHGGAGWTLSRRFFTPSSTTNSQLATAPTGTFTDTSPFGGISPHTLHIEAEPAATPIGPTQVSCVLRNVGTFGVVGDSAATDILEVKGVAPGTPNRAQGQFAGYNIPSLYGLQVGAPFMHHGQANTLEEFLDPDGAWQDHLNAGNAIFSSTLTDDDVEDLVSFLLSIDATTEEFIAVPAGSDECPISFP
jgi:cytochrome c peroxidase